ncbi:MAG TPA: DAK2 domain-containing protein [Tissierellaceae bacterium]|nr:DAK2 domain-containing protein [Tissierellaceae bacterium]
MKIEIIDGELLKKALLVGSALLDKNKEEVNSLNVFPVPDGDTGTNMSLTIKSAVKQASASSEDDTYMIALAASQGSLMGARGNSGVILSQLFRGFAIGIKGKSKIDVITLARGFRQAAETAYKAVMKPTEGTILTVAREIGEFSMSISKEETNILVFLERVIEHGNNTLGRTPEMLPVLKQAGVVDAGGKGLMYIITGIYNSLAGIEDIEYSVEAEEDSRIFHREAIDTDDIEFGYCTEFMIKGNSDEIDRFRNQLSTHGDSLLVVGGDGIIKVHVHTNNPGLVLEKGLELGELSDIKIDNMRYQHEEVLLKEELKNMESKKKIEPSKEYSIVSISIGQGIDEIFKELHVEQIVHGGQTMNPSTEDILKAIELTEGRNVFVLPNNKNIILAAEQTVELSSRNVIVLATKTIPEGIGALLAFDEGSDLDDNINNMEDNIKNILSGQVTYAVRDTEYSNNEIKKDDIIGLSKGDILATGKDVNSVALDLIEAMMNEDISIISIFYGDNLEEEKARELSSLLEEKYSEIDIELLFGGQPLYYYIFSLE